MENGKKYNLFGPDGIVVGYFLNSRYYDYRGDVYAGYVDNRGDFISASNDKVVGKIEGDELITSNAIMKIIECKD